MSSKLTLVIGGVAAVLMLALAGILLLVVSGGGGDETVDSGTPASATADDAAGDGPAASGELRIRGDDPLFLDPAVIQDAGSAVYAVEIFSWLLRLDKNLQLQPDIASRWDVSPDGKTYTFYIDPKATFHDGRPVLADDVKASWERALSPDTRRLLPRTFWAISSARKICRAAARTQSAAYGL